MTEIPLSEFGLVTVSQACDEYGWAAKTVQNWIKADLLPAVVVGSGRSTYLLRASDLAAFTPPPRGRPRAAPPEPVARGAKRRNSNSQGRRAR